MTLWGSGLSLAKVAKQIGASLETVKLWRKNHKADWDCARASLNDELKQAVAEASTAIVPDLLRKRQQLAERMIALIENEMISAEITDDPEDRARSILNMKNIDTMMERWAALPLLHGLIARENTNASALEEVAHHPRKIEIIE